MCDNNLLEWVQLVAKNENLIDYDVEVIGTTKQGDGYLGKIIFVTVTGKTQSEDEKVLNLVIKTSAPFKFLQNKIPIRELFDKEIYIYDEVLPSFNRFQREMGVSGYLDFLVKCYATHSAEDHESLILDNVKVKGYDMWNRKVPMPYDYLKLVLQAYAKWHAFSLVFQRKCPKIFKQLLRNNRNMYPYFMLKSGIDSILHRYFEEARNAWKNDPEVSKVKISKQDVKDMLINYEVASEGVILHGDCWTNNFLFKLDEATQKPTKMYMIDWQFSGLASPIVDLSIFIYSSIDTEKFQDVKEILQIYYTKLNDTLALLQCECTEIFPFQRLVEHWKRYSRFGIVAGIFMLRFSLAESHQVPDYTIPAESGAEFYDRFKFSLADEEMYLNRAKNNILHYVRNLNI